MKKHNFILALLIASFIGFSVQQTFAQKKDNKKYDKWKKDKIIETPKVPPKQLFVEVTIKGGGTCLSFRAKGVTCTWSINRVYSATIALSRPERVPFEEMVSEPGTALEVYQKKVTAKVKANPAAAFNTQWMSILTDYKQGAFDVDVSINDKVEEKWKVKKEKGIEEEESVTQTWTTKKTRGRGTGAHVILDRQNGAFRFMASLDSDATMNYHHIASWEELNPLPIEHPVFHLPMNKGEIGAYLTKPFEGDAPSDANASFEDSFSFHPQRSELGVVSESNTATVTVKYIFGNKH